MENIKIETLIILGDFEEMHVGERDKSLDVA